MTTKQVTKWLRSKNPRLTGATPLEIIEREGSQGAKRVAYELEQLELGGEKAFTQVFKGSFPQFSKKSNPLRGLLAVPSDAQASC